jgi:hypothetical protein
MNDGSGRSTAFNDSAWGDVSCGYTISARKLKDKSIEEITQAAKHFSKCARRRHGGGGASTTGTDSVVDVRANLIDESNDECKSNCGFLN